MRIESSTVALQSAHVAVSQTVVQERTRVWVGAAPGGPEAGSAGATLPSTRVTLSDAARSGASAGDAAQVREGHHAHRGHHGHRARHRHEDGDDHADHGERRSRRTEGPRGDDDAVAAAGDASDAGVSDPQLRMVRQVIESITGRRVEVFDASRLEAKDTVPAVQDPKQTASPQSTPPAGWGAEYDYHAVHDEVEATSFSASGVVRTADGREIRFDLSLDMARASHEETSVSVRLGDAARKDPLVVDFAGAASALSDTRFKFDLDSDGKTEDVPLPTTGSGYLAFDRNDNGRIDNGSELFGPTSGDGFAELATLDADGNRWIDESDPSFARLAIWNAATGNLTGLLAANVGAISLEHVATPFAVKGANNSDLGAVRSTGVYLSEDGKAGVVRQIDVTV